MDVCDRGVRRRELFGLRARRERAVAALYRARVDPISRIARASPSVSRSWVALSDACSLGSELSPLAPRPWGGLGETGVGASREANRTARLSLGLSLGLSFRGALVTAIKPLSMRRRRLRLSWFSLDTACDDVPLRSRSPLRPQTLSIAQSPHRGSKTGRPAACSGSTSTPAVRYTPRDASRSADRPKGATLSR